MSLATQTPKTKVWYTEWGTASFYPDHIEINKAFKNDKKLRDYVIKHELNHKNSFDVHHDLLDVKPQTFRLIKFVLMHPKTWIDFLPIQVRNKEVIIDYNLMILYGLSLSLIAILFIIIK